MSLTNPEMTIAFQFSYSSKDNNIRPFIRIGVAWAQDTLTDVIQGTTVRDKDIETSWRGGIAYSPGDFPWEIEIGGTWRFAQFASEKKVRFV